MSVAQVGSAQVWRWQEQGSSSGRVKHGCMLDDGPRKQVMLAPGVQGHGGCGDKLGSHPGTDRM